MSVSRRVRELAKLGARGRRASEGEVDRINGGMMTYRADER